MSRTTPKPHAIMAEYRDCMAPGSYLVITHGTKEKDAAAERDGAAEVYREAPSHLHLRTLPHVRRLFDGFELVDPGWSGSQNGARSRALRRSADGSRCAAASATSP